jgi:hypothetical protein
VSELVAEDAETAWRVAESPGYFGGRGLFDEEGTQGLVLTMQGLLGGAEESGSPRIY